MAHLLASNPSPSHKIVCSNLGYGAGRGSKSDSCRVGRKRRGGGLVLQCSSSTSTSTSTSSSQLPCVDQDVRLQIENGSSGKLKQQFEYLACEYGWRVRRLFENADEIRKASEVQAEAFHVPVSIFNDVFLQFFQAEVLSGLLYKLKNSPPNRIPIKMDQEIKRIEREFLRGWGKEGRKIAWVKWNNTVNQKSVEV